MTYKVIWNGHKYWEETIKAKTWLEFINELNGLTANFSQPPDIIYLISER